jgi:hypothetical protein
MVGVYFESLSWCSSLRLLCRAEVGRRVAVEDSQSELRQTAHLVPNELPFLAVDTIKEARLACVGWEESVETTYHQPSASPLLTELAGISMLLPRMPRVQVAVAHEVCAGQSTYALDE